MQDLLFKAVFEISLKNDLTVLSFRAGSQESYYTRCLLHTSAYINVTFKVLKVLTPTPPGHLIKVLTDPKQILH